MFRNSCVTRRRASVLMPRPSRSVLFSGARCRHVLTAQPGPRFLNVQQPRHAPSSGTRDQLVDYHDVCTSFESSTRRPLPRSTRLFFYDPYELTRHDICYRQHHQLLRSWRGDTGVAQDTQPVSTAAATLLQLLHRFFLYFFGQVFSSPAFAMLFR